MAIVFDNLLNKVILKRIKEQFLIISHAINDDLYLSLIFTLLANLKQGLAVKCWHKFNIALLCCF